MKALTLWQPWATLIAVRLKSIETRSWDTRYRGPLAIHSAARKFRGSEGEQWLMKQSDEIFDAIEDACGGITDDRFPPGVVICTCSLVDTVQFPHPSAPPDPYGYFTAGRFGWRLENITPLEVPIAAKGKQGLWEWVSK